MKMIAAFSSMASTRVAGTLLPSISFKKELGNTDYYFEKVKHLKARINEAYSLLLTEEMLLPVEDDSFLQIQEYKLTGLCYDTEDILSKLENEVGMGLVMSSKLPSHIDNAVAVFEKQLTFLEGKISSLRMDVQLSKDQMTPSTRRNKSFPPRHGKQAPLVGRDGDVMAIVQELISPDKCETFGVSIVGMNGVGKSALAEEILNHDSVAKLFRHRLWASLSGPFNPEKIGKQLVEFYRTVDPEFDAQVSNYGSLCRLLETNSWLIVLDNLLDVTFKEWSNFQSSFLPSSKGKLLITTVDVNLSVATQTTRYYLHSMSDEQCQQVILYKTVSGINGGPCSSIEINTLAKKCCGLPLVASFMGAQLSNDEKRKTLMERDLCDVPEFRREILPTLASTYSMLQPVHLRKCFAYFSLFPPGYHFNMEDLIHLWIGEGFIQCQDESSLEQVGKDYFQTLMRWSILQPLGVGCDGGPDYYKIHEFTYKLAKLFAPYTCIFLDKEAGDSGIMPKNPRHMSLSCIQHGEEYLKLIEMLKGLRTLLSLGNVKFSSFPITFFSSLTYIRVLSLKHTDVVEIPVTIKLLELLRYLDISDTPICRLPEAVSTLRNLRILKFRNTKNLLQLPKKFQNLIALRYIDWDLSDMKRLTSLPSSIGKLTSLRKLPLFEVRKEKGYSIRELRDMSDLQGSICITNLENITDIKEATEAKLSKKTSLQEIEFQWTSSSSAFPHFISNDVLTELEPHKSLKILQITNYGGCEFPKWLSYLHNLETIALRGGNSCILLPALGHLPVLKFLRIENMRLVSSLEDLYHNLLSDKPQFPELESLVLKNLPELHQWKGLTKACLPCLRDLAIVGCPKLISLPSLEHLTSLVNLHIIECAALGLLPELPSSLMSLIINKCDLLIERCQIKDQHWSMANRIPNLWISDQVIPTQGDPNIQVIDEPVYLTDSKFQANTTDVQPFEESLDLDEPLHLTDSKCQANTTDLQAFDESVYLTGSKFQANRMYSLMRKVIEKFKENVIKKYTTTLVNKIVPTSEAETCKEELTQFPHHLEMMFHCLLFPKEYKFEKARLVQLWVAGGFLTNEPMEDDGNRFFKFLLDKSFIIATTNDISGGTEMYQFNSMKFSSSFDEMGLIKHFDEKKESATMVANRFAGNWDISVTSGEIDQEAFGLLTELGKLRSILFLNASLLTRVPSYIFPAFKCLRTLDLSYSGIKELPDFVINAKQLCYLDLSWTLIEKLPNSVADLCELKALRLGGCVHLFYLPKRMKQLIKLRHLDFDILGQLSSMPEGMGALVELRTLQGFIVGCEDSCNIKELENMNHLSGKLCISGLENVIKVEDAQGAALSKKQFLQRLELRWSNIFEMTECNYVGILQGLQPHTCLEGLQIIGFPGLEFPKWVGDHSYINLVSIILYNCEDCEDLPILGNLPKLQRLEIIEMHGVKEIDDKIPFLKLQTLTIDGMHNLEKWSGLNGDNFPTIINLNIKHCPELRSLQMSSSPSENVPQSLPCFHVEIVNCSKLASLPEKLLSNSLQTLIIEDCPFGNEYREGGKDRSNITNEAKVWVFPDNETSHEDPEEDDVSTEINSNSNADERNNLENGFIQDDDQSSNGDANYYG